MEGDTIQTEKVQRFKTFAALDLETTGLPGLEFNKTKITELAIVAATRDHIVSEVASKEKLPRVLFKLNICFYPQRLISAGSSEVTGLYNDMLVDCKPFDQDAFIVLEKFLQRLPEPVCIIAHNGLRFDFPILQAEFHKLGKKLPESLMCADSLPAFRELLGQRSQDANLRLRSAICRLPVINDSPRTTTQDSLFSNNRTMLSQTESFSWDEADNVLCDALEKFEAQHINANTLSTDCNTNSFSETQSTPQPSDMHAIREAIEKTPSQRTTAKSLRPRKKENELAQLENQDPSKLKRLPHNIRKRLFYQGTELQGKVLKKFKLGDVYHFLLNEEAVDSHRAENDAVNLMKCVVASGVAFAEWVDKNAKNFNNIPPLS